MDSLDKILKEDATIEDLERKLQEAIVDLNKKYKAPDHCLKIIQHGNSQKLFTLGNFSVITGRQKSKKTFLTSFLTASCTKQYRLRDTFESMIYGKKCVYFDTEQSHYDAWKIGNVIKESEGDTSMVDIVSLRPYSPGDRLNLIEYAIKKDSAKLGFVVIDGVTDLVTSINSEEEAVNIVTRLLRWTAEYNIHINVVIHQRKGDTFARGHIGTAVINKAECVISSTKDELESSRSIIKCEDMRGGPSFEDLHLEIRNGLPEIYPAIPSFEPDKF